MDDNSAALMALLRKQTSTAEADKNKEEKDKSCGMYRREYFSEDYTQHGISDMCREMEYDDSAPVEEVVCRVDEVPEGGSFSYPDTQEPLFCRHFSFRMHEVELRGRKIVIVRDKGKFSAVNGLCAHYNWPLINGFYSNGKIRCQLHGACFNTGTGDIEDYPTFDGLHPFNVRKIGENLVISTTEKRLGSDRHTKPNWIRRITTEKPIIIVGGGCSGLITGMTFTFYGPAAQSIAENLRVEGSRTPIIMMTKESITPYDRVLLSKRLDNPAVALRTEEFYTENHIVVRLNSEVTSIDPPYHTLTLADGSLHEYSKVVIAVGGAVRKLRNEGADLKGIHTLRNHADPAGIMAEAKGEDVVCIGASFIGTEAACALVGEAKSVTVICTTAEPVPALGEAIGRSLRLYFEGKCIKIITNARVSKLTGADGRVQEVHLVDGTVLPARCVVAGIGVDPDTAWMAECGIELDKRGFVKTAQKHGQMAARSMLNKPIVDHNVPFFWAMYFWIISIRFAGVSEGHDSTVLRGDTDSFVFVQYYFRDNRVIAVCSAGPSLASIQFESMCSRKITLTREMVENAPDDNLSVYLK
ncbi:hypothetical protein PRIPAC_95925 [Pristionchus pacificus]|uniref:Pyridine nucleotide-disulfide oxidoreductase n=1 Tax=Pristionchus pacificus TaxID=54126 RepID=A0A2A6CH57_PRIPA|nr:hypothetical protein PRIPAC_95925 [Pristionchus pacificus]|eukprot:PDM77420.1 pyridine nucleotide-disulfide oxidoreductase [Pristionchus pacificus]